MEYTRFTHLQVDGELKAAGKPAVILTSRTANGSKAYVLN